MDYNQNTPDNKPNPFSIASMICGITSIVLCCTGVLSLPLGALGILFAILTKRLGKPLPFHSITGVTTSCIGILLGLIMLIYTLFLISTDPEYQKLFQNTYEYYYDYYGYDLQDM